ncbi:MAG TPA: hypothetical protein VMZ30_17680 [Pyrinomonadaceae bacterium]|nr:hypothetical protein [Pyrinomonadaceae bacterium]
MFPKLLLMFLVLLTACNARPAGKNSSASQSRRVISYVANISPTGEFCRQPDGCQWRMIDPRTGSDELIMPLEGIPLNVWWNPEYTQVYYRLESKLFRTAWRVGAKPEMVFTVNEVLARKPDTVITIEDIWQDGATGKWRLKTLQYEGVGENERAVAGVWEHEPNGQQWFVLDKQPTECGCGDCACASVMNKWIEPRPRVALHELLDTMRAAWHLDRASADEDWAEGRRSFISLASPRVSYEFDLVFGDSYHAMAPFVLQRGGSSGPQTIYPKGGPCGDQLSFAEEAGFLLLTAEYTGACGRVVNLQSGATIASLPETAKYAAWLERPKAH